MGPAMNRPAPMPQFHSGDLADLSEQQRVQIERQEAVIERQLAVIDWHEQARIGQQAVIDQHGAQTDQQEELIEQQAGLIERQDTEIRALKVRVAELERRPLQDVERGVNELRTVRQESRVRFSVLKKMVPHEVISWQAMSVWVWRHKTLLGTEKLDGTPYSIYPSPFWDLVEKRAAKKGIVFARDYRFSKWPRLDFHLS